MASLRNLNLFKLAAIEAALLILLAINTYLISRYKKKTTAAVTEFQFVILLAIRDYIASYH